MKEEGADRLPIEFAHDSTFGKHLLWSALLPMCVPPLREHLVVSFGVGSHVDAIHFRRRPRQVRWRVHTLGMGQIAGQKHRRRIQTCLRLRFFDRPW